MLSSSSLLFANDKAGAYPDSYYSATATPIQGLSSLKGALQCDVAVIGGGFTGLSAAYHLAERGFDVVVLDAHRVGWGASGRNGGQLALAQREDQEDIEKLVGIDDAKALWKLGRQANALVKSLISDNAIVCDLKAGALYTDHKASYTESTKQHIAHMQEVYDYHDLKFHDSASIQALLGTKAYHSGVYYGDAGHLHPLKFALGLAQAAMSKGARVFENSLVTKCEDQLVTTEQGQVSCKSILFACNGYLGDLAPQVGNRVMPINNFIVATEPLSDKLANEVIKGSFAVADSRFVVNYYRKSADDRLLFGGGETYSYKFPTDIKQFVKSEVLKIYPQLAETRIDYGWGGTLAITMNRMPHLARLSKSQWSASGYSGSGVGMATLSGQLLAEAVDANLSRFDVMAKIPTPRFPGGTLLRKPLLAAAMSWYALRDRL